MSDQPAPDPTTPDLFIKVAIDPPKVPNFVRFKGSNKTVSVGDLSDDQLRKLGQDWTAGLLARAAEIRAGRAKDESP